jgi:hypothetical protein
MRSNGLTASAYSPVADLEPQVAEALLDDLRHRGVAAYTTPVETSTTTGFDVAEFRVAIKDRLYVDANAYAEVRQIIASTAPQSELDNDDLTWAQIIAGYDAPFTAGAAVWPAREDLDHDWVPRTEDRQSGDRQSGSFQSARDAGPVPPGRTLEPSVGDESFIPAEPPPLPHLDPYQQLAWIGLVGGPLLLLISGLFALALPVWLSLAAVFGFVGGFLTLVATMEDRSTPDGGSDDGAVI